MFEQAVLTERRRPWTLAVSATLQSAFVGAAVLLSMLSIERLPSVMLPAPLPPLPSGPKPVEIVATEITRTAVAAATAVRGLIEPTRVPKDIAFVNDPPAEAGAPAYNERGLVGTGLPEGMYSQASSVITRSTLPPAPPQQEAAKPAQTATAPPTVIRLGGVVLEGKLVKRVMPEYPVLARQARVSGRVQLMGVVGRDGLVRELKVVSGPPLLIQAALNAVRQWVYSPTYLNGEPVEVMAPIEVNFTLSR